MSCWSGRPQRLPEHGLLPSVLDDHQHLMVRSYCWRHHVAWLEDREKSSRSWRGSFLADTCLAFLGWNVLPRQLGERCHQHLPPGVNSSCKVRHARWCNSGRTVTVITRRLLTASEVHSIGGSSCIELCTWSKAHDLVPGWRGQIYCFHFAKWTCYQTVS